MKIELLGRAAAAVGIEHRGWVDSATEGTGLAVPGSPDIALVTRSGSEYGWWIWNPWDDDGDAFRLAVYAGVEWGYLPGPGLGGESPHVGWSQSLDLTAHPLTPLERLAWLREHIVREVVARNNQNGLYWQNTNTGETK